MKYQNSVNATASSDNSFITTPLPVCVEIPRLRDPFIREKVIATNWKPQSRHLMQAPIIPKQPRYCLKKTTDRRKRSNEAIVSTAIKMANYRKSVDCVNLIRNKKDLEQYLKESSAKEFNIEPIDQIQSNMTVKSQLHSMIGNTKFEHGPSTGKKKLYKIWFLKMLIRTSIINFQQSRQQIQIFLHTI